MISAIIIDDETKGRTALRAKIQAYCPQIKIIAEASSAQDAILLIQQHKPQLIFLDIEMPRMNGFEMLNALKEKNFYIIFTTAYDQYAIKAIKYSAFDYLLKPIDIEELKIAVAHIELKESNQTKKQVELLAQNMQHPKKQLNKLAIPTLEGLLFFDINDIIHLEANSNYTLIHFTGTPKITASKTLKEFEDILPESIFFRTHHSHLINLNYIKRYIKGDGGQIELQNGNFVDVSRRKKEAFLKAIGY
ncbi:MAG: response regulator [Chitinophagaceae bacterium]|nr:response regulator [Chitinophagaceae bacterium]MBK7557021.1 response regulator [Chitinophagaceae bacterium]MBK9532423.1 response regulator [Chitinophagaceae bacterium]